VSDRLKGLLRLAVSAGLLLVLFLVFDPAEVAARLAHLDLRWLLPALLLSVLQIMLLAWRWRFTADRLQVGMSDRHALGEYYAGVSLNQVLPGGILGDVSRAWRHASAAASGARGSPRGRARTGGRAVADGGRRPRPGQSRCLRSAQERR
jgi:glycosyltransferase 2 family protein